MLPRSNEHNIVNPLYSNNNNNIVALHSNRIGKSFELVMLCIDSRVWSSAFRKEPGSVKGNELLHPCAPSAHSWALQEALSQVPGGILVSTLWGAVVSLESSAAVRGIEQGLHTEAERDLKNTALRATE